MPDPTPDPNGRISAIGTTGIYCRPGCPGRPLERNRTRYASALAAEAAGYRACLRCRPEREPQFEFRPDWPAEVSRGLWAIATGWWERHGVEEGASGALAAALGVDRAELDAAFVEHVGATPERAASSRRLHVARSLLDYTDLSHQDIAVAVGLPSAEALCAQLTDTYGFAPDRLRRNRYAREARAVAARAPALRVPLHHWPNAGVHATIAYLRSRAIPGVEEATDTGYRRLVAPRSGGSSGCTGAGGAANDWVDLTHDDTGTWIEIADPAGYGAPGEVLDIITRARRVLALDELSSAHATTLTADPTLGPHVRAAQGRRLAGAWDPFETAVRIIVGQQVTVSAASTLAGRVLERCGSLTAEAVASASLDGVGMPGSRVATLQGLAEAVAAGEVDLDHLGNLDSAITALTALRGIGPWTAQLIAARVLRHANAWPVKDLGLIRAWESLGGSGHVDAASDAWEPHRAAAIAYLWSSA